MNNVEYRFKATAYRVASLAFLLVHIVLLLLQTLLITPEGKEANLTVAVLLVAPLILFMPWILVRNLRAHAWLCFASLWFFMLAVPSAFDPRYGFLAQWEFANSVLLFLSTMLFVRYEQRRLGISITR